MKNIVIAMEPDVEALRHHMSMAVPFGAIGWQNHRWDTKAISAYDMFDQVTPDLIMCNHKEFNTNTGLRECVEERGINCLIRHEAPGDILRETTKTYTRYRNTEFKEYLPSCADVIAYRPISEDDRAELRNSRKNVDGFQLISIKNYLPYKNSGMWYTSSRFNEYKLDSSKLNRSCGGDANLKIFRGYNTNSPYHCGDLSDRELCKIVQQQDTGISAYGKGELFVTSDLLNILHCGIGCYVNSEEGILNFWPTLYDYFEVNLSCKDFFKKKYLTEKGTKYTNFDRAIEISQIFELGVEKELKNESVKYQ